MRRLPRGPLIAIIAGLAVVAASFASHGPSRASAANVDTGVWGTPFTPPNAITAVHMALLNNGKVLMFGEEGVTAIWNPVSNTTVRINLPGPIFCGGHTILPDGRIFWPAAAPWASTGRRSPRSSIPRPTPGRRARTCRPGGTTRPPR